MIETKLKAAIRDVPDFPKPGIVFKDITPLLKDRVLRAEIVDALCHQVAHLQVDVIVGIESRGFLFGMLLADRLQVPFVPIRKKGKLPYKTICESYDLEYGTAAIEMHADAFPPHTRVLVHDDLLATGGTAVAVAKLIQKLEGQVVGFSFVVSLDFLNGQTALKAYSEEISSLVGF